MKKVFMLFIAVASLTAFKIAVENNSAIVDEKNGMKIFCYSKPVAKYDILGMAKVRGIVTSERGEHLIDLLIENAKKNFPSGEAIIVGSEFDKAEVIRFRE